MSTIEDIEQRGPRSQRETVVDILLAADYGDLVTYDTLGHALGLPFARSNPEDRRRVGRVVNRALPELENEHRKTAVSVAKEGYRIAHPAEHTDVGHRRQLKANRTLRRASRVVKAADHNLLTDSERADNLEAQRHLRDQLRAANLNNLAKVRRDRLKAAMDTPTNNKEIHT